MKFRRRREFKTSYKRRKKLLTSRLPFVYVFTSNKNVWAQIIEPAVGGDRVLVHASSKDLEKSGWKYSRKSYPAHYLVGLLLGKRAAKAGISEVIYYSGIAGFVAGSRAAALLKGLMESGIKVRVDSDALPDDEAVSGARIAEYYKALSASGYSGPQFSRVKDEAQDIQKAFNDMKGRIENGEVS